MGKRHSAQVRQALLFSSVLATFLAGCATQARSTAPHSAPASTNTTTSKGSEMATFAAGCFWSMEAIFKQLRGVEQVEPGYSGGTVPNPTYELVETGTTGYAESINIAFDPKVISYHNLVQILLTVRDPTTLDKQGPDEGTQYRSVIFFRNEKQKQTTMRVINEITKSRIWQNPIITTVVPFAHFYRAEDYHLDYYNRHSDQPYCKYVIAPEIREFRAKFASKLKE